MRVTVLKPPKTEQYEDSLEYADNLKWDESLDEELTSNTKTTLNWPSQTKPTKPNQTKPNQTKPNQSYKTKPSKATNSKRQIKFMSQISKFKQY